MSLKSVDGLCPKPQSSIALIALLILMGCATTADFSSMEVVKSEAFDESANALSKCSMSALSAQERGYAFRQLADREKIVIEAQVADAADMPGKYVQFQLQFEAVSPRKSVVSVRSLKTVWGGFVYPESIWPLIRQCVDDK